MQPGAPPLPWSSPRVSRSFFSVDDTLAIRELFENIVQQTDGLNWAGGCGSLGEARRRLQSTERPPDLVLLDVSLSDGRGWELLNEPVIASGRSKVAFVTGRRDERTLLSCLQRAVVGYLDKTSCRYSDWKKAFGELAAGRVCYAPDVLEQIQHLRSKADHWSRFLTPREQDLLQLFCDGLDNLEVSNRAGISPQTALAHRRSVMRKLNVHSTTALMRWARTAGIV